MGTYKDKSEWVDEIYTVETYTPVLGGATAWAGNEPVSGYSNASIEQLADRTRWNRDTLESIERELGVKTDGVMLGKNNLSELTDIQEAKYRIELNLVDNVRDMDKPVSNPQQEALNKKTDKTTVINTTEGIEGGGNLSQSRTLKLTNAVWNILNDVANKANSSVTIVAGSGLTGGGNLTANRTINIGTPSESSVTSTNSASGSTHSHALSAGVKASLVKADNAAPLNYTNTELGKKADKTINVSAGTGLSGGGNLSANRTISLSPDSIASLGKADSSLQPVAGHGLYPDVDKTKLAGVATGATKNATDAQLRDRTTHTGVQPINTVTGLQGALDSKVDNTDSRLTNSREWTGATVSQAEAEAGTATTRRAWTAQRVRQAITSWWATVGGVFGKTLLNSSDANAAKSSLGLHSVASSGNYNELSNKPASMTQTEANAGSSTTARLITPKVLVDTVSAAVSGGVSADALTKANNLSDVPNKATARSNLGLSDAATTSVASIRSGTTKADVGLSNVTNVAQAAASTQVIAGNGLSGGGTLAANRTITLGTPSSLTKTATNSVSTTSHTHELGADVKASLAKADSAVQPSDLSDAATTTVADIRSGVTKADVGLSGIPNTNASTANFLRGDGTWVTPPNTNTTYAEITTAEIDAGTAATLRTISGRRMKYALDSKANTSTQVIAGTGLTGGGTLAANRTLNVTYGTAAGTAAQGNDSRLSNSREWTAAVVSQAEAQAGTATTARKWTAQRVAQAISAIGLKIGTTASTAKAGNWMPTWANVTGKPSTFTPSAHTHSLSQITDAGSVASLNTNASTANFLRGDGTWVTPPNNTYSTMSVAELRAGTVTTARTMSAKNINDFSTFVALTGTSITPNLNSGRNFTLSLSGNTTINNPTNLRSGQTGDIAITVGATEHTLSFGSTWKFAGGNVPETKANSITVISYKVVDASTIICGVGTEVK